MQGCNEIRLVGLVGKMRLKYGSESFLERLRAKLVCIQTVG